MKLVNEIIEMAADGKRPVADALRKCLILSFELKNDRLKEWAEKELNGYGRDDAVPEYRCVALHSKGNFSGPAGAWIPQRPLPLGILEEKHRKWLTTKFAQPIATYDVGSTDEKHNAVIPWPPDLIVHYQAKFIEGYALSQAWQEVPTSVLIALCEEVRNRLLRFALEIREELGQVDDKPKDLPVRQVDAAVVNYIYGGTNVIAGAASDFTQIGTVQISEGDLVGFANSLKRLGIAQEDVEEATKALVEDGKPKTSAVGKKVGEWIKAVGSKLGDAGLKIGTGAAQQLITQWMMQYWGLKP
jgi:hypothetical protein